MEHDIILRMSAVWPAISVKYYLITRETASHWYSYRGGKYCFEWLNWLNASNTIILIVWKDYFNVYISLDWGNYFYFSNVPGASGGPARLRLT